MKGIEKVTNLLVAVGTVLTAMAAIYKEYNASQQEKKEETN